MENKERNLASLKAEFHDKGKANRGYKNIMTFIDKNKKDELKQLLRYHEPVGVYGQELVDRFEIDALIEYYNLLLIAIFAGYVPGKLDATSANEIITTLEHPSVIPYYQEYYRYKMVSYTLQYAKENKVYELEGNALTLSAFNEFISLNRILKRDKDIERFLGMLDFVWYDNDNLAAVNAILSSEKKLNDAFTAKDKTEAQSAVWGFIKYSSFLSQLKELLLSTDDYPLLQSSFWMFHGYFFDRMNEEMKEIFNNAFNNLEKSLSNPSVFNNIIEEMYGTELPESFNETELSSFAKSAIKQSREDVFFVLDIKWSAPLKEYFKH